MSAPEDSQSSSRIENRGLWITAVSALGAGILWWQAGVQAAILLLASVVLVSAIWLFWVSLQALVGKSKLTLDEALGLAAPSAAEEQKRATLRILKDLEYERGVGKLSEEDYQALVQHYRAEAKGLLRDLDDSLGPLRARAERRLAKRLAALERGEAKAGAAPESPAEASETADSSGAKDGAKDGAQGSADRSGSENQDPDDRDSGDQHSAKGNLDDLVDAIEDSLERDDHLGVERTDSAATKGAANPVDSRQAEPRDSAPGSEETSGVREHASQTGDAARRATPPAKPTAAKSTLDGTAKFNEEDAT